MSEQDQQIRVLYELFAMTVHVLRSPPLPSISLISSPPQISPAAFGSLFIWISASLMLFGSVTFAIGFIMMPLVIALVMLFYVAGFISILSEFSRAVLRPPRYSTHFSTGKSSD